MKIGINELKPKVGRLSELVTSWHFVKSADNIALSEAILSILSKRSLPKPIAKFIRIPKFKELLSNMQEGRLYKKGDIPDPESEEDLPSPEMQNLQTLVDAFHKLVNLDYEPKKADDPFLALHLILENILDHAFCMETLSSYDHSLTKPVLIPLQNNLKKLLKKASFTVSKHPNRFRKEVKALQKQASSFNSLKELIQTTYDILSFLTLGSLPIDNEVRAIASAHKILNQLQTLFREISLFYQRNLPYYTPLDIKASEESLEEIFKRDKYRVIEAKERSIQVKFEALLFKLHSLEKSLFLLVEESEDFFPDPFTKHIKEVIEPLSFLLPLLKMPSPIVAQLISGFYNAQYDHLSDLLHETASFTPSDTTPLLPKLTSFLALYHQVKPLAPFCKIKTILETKGKTEEAFSLLTSTKTLSDIEPLFYPAFAPLQNKIPETLIKKLENIDLPSFSASWYLFGEIVGSLFISGYHHDPKTPSKALSLFSENAPYFLKN